MTRKAVVKGIPSLLLIVVCAGRAAASWQNNIEALPPLERRLQMEVREGDNPWIILPHRTNYILPVAFASRVNKGPFRRDGRDTKLQNVEAKFQLSFKYPLGRKMILSRGTLYFAYTQISLWQVYNGSESSPFRETNYEPELFLSFEGETDLAGFVYRLGRVGISHESNGREEGPRSRSWNRIYIEAFFDHKNFVMSVKPWWRIPESKGDDQNPNMEKYYGYGELRLGYRLGEAVVTAMVRNNLRTADNKGALEIGMSFPLTKRVKAYLQFFSGYGETLVDYDFPIERLGFGFLLADWI